MSSLSKQGMVKNRAPAPIQISSEQLLREARDRKIELDPKPPRQQITDKDELQEYRTRRRKEFEDAIRMQRQHLGNYIKYAMFEEQQQEFERARSIFERGIDIDYRNQSIWLKYSEMEMRNKFVNHARNVYDRAVSLLPRVDQFWFKYTYFEEMLGNAKLCRQIFERWMKWEPDDLAFGAFAKFEIRCGELGRSRAVMEQYCDVHPTLRAYLKLAKWEEKHGEPALARSVYERALVELPDEEERESEKLFILFAQFEERQGEHDRARVIYKYALDQLGREQMPDLYRNFIAFEKKHGNREGIEEVIVGKRRLQYEESVAAAPHDFDAWFDYARLEEEEVANAVRGVDRRGASFDGDVVYERARDVYERAISQVPPVQEKRFWRRYVYLWINYALFEEMVAQDTDRTRAVYKGLLDTIPHDAFSFAKAFALAAHFEVRQLDLSAARRIMGQGVGRCGRLGKEKVFKDYIHLERQLGEIDRCRTLYKKYLEFMPTNCGAWARFADLERSLGENTRARAVFEVAISQPSLDMPEVLWKQYIDFEISVAREAAADGPDEDDPVSGGAVGCLERVRELYERLLDRTKHVKVWISYATFEATEAKAVMDTERARLTAPDSSSSSSSASLSAEFGQGGIDDARSIFRKAYTTLKDAGLKEQRVTLLEAWRDLEKEQPRSQQSLEEVAKLMPKKVKKRRLVTSDDGEEQGWEEYYDYHFPDDRSEPMNLKILEMAHQWKRTGALPTAAARGNNASDGADRGFEVDSGSAETEAEEQASRRGRGEPSAKRARADPDAGAGIVDSAEIEIDDHL